MKKATKIWIIVAASLVALGLILFIIVASMRNWDFSKTGTESFRDVTFEITEEANSVTVDTDTANVSFVKAEDGACKVVYYGQEKIRSSVEVRDGTLYVSVFDARKWYERAGIVLRAPELTVYLPNDEYDLLSVKESTGNIKVPEDFAFNDVRLTNGTGKINLFASASGNVNITVTTGDVLVKNVSANSVVVSGTTGKAELSGVDCAENVSVTTTTGGAIISAVKCKNIISEGKTGDLTLKNVIASEKISAVRTTGNVKFEASDAAEIFTKTHTGNVTGTLLSTKIFIVNTNTGKKEVPASITGGKCEISTKTGNVKIEIADK